MKQEFTKAQLERSPQMRRPSSMLVCLTYFMSPMTDLESVFSDGLQQGASEEADTNQRAKSPN